MSIVPRWEREDWKVVIPKRGMTTALQIHETQADWMAKQISDLGGVVTPSKWLSLQHSIGMNSFEIASIVEESHGVPLVTKVIPRKDGQPQ